MLSGALTNLVALQELYDIDNVNANAVKQCAEEAIGSIAIHPSCSL